MDVSVKVCDVDPIVGQPTARWAITMPGGELVELDLCSEHAEPVAVLVEKKLAQGTMVKPGPSKRAAKKAAPASDGRRRGRSVTTLSAVEAGKR